MRTKALKFGVGVAVMLAVCSCAKGENISLGTATAEVVEST